MSSEGSLTLQQCHLLNRLGETDHVCAILDDHHFITILPGREVLHYSSVIKKFMIQKGADGEQLFFDFPRGAIEFPHHTVIVLTYEESTPCLDIYPNDPEYIELMPTARLELRMIEPDREIDISVGKLHHTAQEIFEKAMKRLDLLEAPLKNRPDLPKFNYSPAATRVLLGLDHIMHPNAVAPPVAEPSPAIQSISLMAIGATSASDPTSPKDQSLADVMAILSDDKKPAAQQVTDGVAPKPPTLAIEPTITSGTSDDDKAAAYQKFNDANKLSGLTGLFQALLKVQKMQQDGRKTPYSITEPTQASLAFDENANFAWQVISGSSSGGGLAGYFMNTSTSTGSFNKDVERTQFSLNFTKDLFKPYGIAGDKEMEIAGAIEQYISAVASIKLDSSDKRRTVSHFIPMNLVQHINISGDDNDKLMVYQPRAKFLYLRIDGEAYSQAISTCLSSESTERFKFSMNYAVFEADINWQEVEKNSEKLDKVFKILSNENLDQYVAQGSIISKIGSKETNPSGPGPVDPLGF
ncbi:hypothetical protein NHQ30_007254 [Ciborinia camelliae]|nr:hypothetical protein NHQ30_007254 [Ciborinia camelliae]